MYLEKAILIFLSIFITNLLQKFSFLKIRPLIILLLEKTNPLT